MFCYFVSMNIPGYLTTKQAAEKLGISVGRVQQFIANKRLPAIKVGHTNLVKESDLELVENRKRGRPAKDDQTESK